MPLLLYTHFFLFHKHFVADFPGHAGTGDHRRHRSPHRYGVCFVPILLLPHLWTAADGDCESEGGAVVDVDVDVHACGHVDY